MCRPAWQPCVKFDSCNNLLSCIHTFLVNILRYIRLYVETKILLLILGSDNYNMQMLTSWSINQSSSTLKIYWADTAATGITQCNSNFTCSFWCRRCATLLKFGDLYYFVIFAAVCCFLGTIGFFACFWFVRKIYGSIDVDDGDSSEEHPQKDFVIKKEVPMTLVMWWLHK